MQDELDKAAGARLREIRTAAGLSQEDLSFATQVDQSTLSKVERLGPGAIGWGRFCAIVKALGYEVEVTYRATETTGTGKVSRAGGPESARRR